MELLELLSNIRAIRLERKTLEELINDLIEREKPADYPKGTISEEKVQTHFAQKTAEKVLHDLQLLLFNLAVQKDNLMALEIEATQRIYKEITDPLQRVFIIKRFIQNKPVKEIIRDFGMPKTSFYRTFENFFDIGKNGTKWDKKNSSRCDTM